MKSWQQISLIGLAILMISLSLWLAHSSYQGREADRLLIPKSELSLADIMQRLNLGDDIRILEVEWEGGSIYELELLRPNGQVFELKVDFNTARIIEEEVE